MLCPKCGAQVPEQNNFCEQCGFDLREIRFQENLLENDPQLARMNHKYINRGILRLVSGGATALCLFFFYQSLEGNLPDSFGIFGMLLFLPALIVFLIACILRGTIRGKIKRTLSEKYSGVNPPSALQEYPEEGNNRG